jgi:capsular exopolysaccharide synthesis family protein
LNTEATRILELTEAELDLRKFLKVVRRHVGLILVTVIGVVLVAGIISWRLTPIYQATALVEVLPFSSPASGHPSLEVFIDPRSALQTQVELIAGDRVLDLAAEQLDLVDTEALKEALDVQLLDGTQIVRIRIENENPVEARTFANAIADAYIEFRRTRAEETSLSASEEINRQMQELRARISEIEALGQSDQPGSSAKIEKDRLSAQLSALEGQLLVLPDAEALRQGGGTIVSRAETPQNPVRPRKGVNIGIAFIVGLVGAVALAFVAESFDDRVKNAEDLEKLLGIPVLGHIPIVEGWATKEVPSLAIDNEASSSAAEAYRTLRTNLRFVSIDSPIKSLLITSPTAGAGKTTTATNLAAIFATGGSKTILVAGDLRKPAAHRVLGLNNVKGIAQSIDEQIPLHEMLQRHERTNLRLLAAGGTPPNPTEVLASGRFGDILNQLTRASDIVIVDSPPILGLGDVSALASRVDGILLVVNAATVIRKELLDAADQIHKAGGKLVGCVMNAVDAKDGYGYYYQNYYADYAKQSGPSANGAGLDDPEADMLRETAPAEEDPAINDPASAEKNAEPALKTPEETR